MEAIAINIVAATMCGRQPVSRWPTVELVHNDDQSNPLGEIVSTEVKLAQQVPLLPPDTFHLGPGRRFRAKAPRHQPGASSACPRGQGPPPPAAAQCPAPAAAWVTTGSTETCPIVTSLPAGSPGEMALTAGKAVLYHRVRIVDAAGTDVAAGEPGEV